MSVIIRLQNLPWSANAMDIRQFFKGLSIPEGGVHIVGGEMGDAFIAFSTDEDARQGMMYDRKAINGVQIRLLLSSRAEMQKVIETARQQSLMALKNASLAHQPAKISSPVVSVPTKMMVPTPQPPVITASSFHNIMSNPSAATPSFLAYQQQAGITLIPDPNISNISTKVKNNNNDSDDSEMRDPRERRRSVSRDRRRSRSRSRDRGIFRRRRERSRDRSRERDWRRSSRRSHSRERSRAHSRDRSRERTRNNRDGSRRNSRDNNSKSRNVDSDVKSKKDVPSRSASNPYQANYNNSNSSSKTLNTAQAQQISKVSGYQANQLNQFNKLPMVATNVESVNKFTNALPSSAAATVSVTAVSTTFQNYNTNNSSLTALNNYSLSSLLAASTSNDSYKGFALQNPYTTALNRSNQESPANTASASTSTIPGIFLEKKSEAIGGEMPNTIVGTGAIMNTLPQEPIAFANVNPYEQMYPNLFAQAASIGSLQKSNSAQHPKQSLHSASTDSSSPKMTEENKPKEVDPNETNCIKISNMGARTTYSDLRKFFVGLFIPHNGIKMLNDKHGLRVGIAYVQFSRQSSVSKALCRTNNLLKAKSIIIEPVAEKEFDEAEDSFRPNNQYHGNRDNDSDQENTENTEDNNSEFSPLNPFKKIISTEPFTVLYIEDIPALATEQDIMKMFSSYSLYDILLLASPENRREFVAHVRFSREGDAKSAYEDRAHHQIGYRRLRVRPGTIDDMDNAKEKIRIANEQLMKEEKAAKVAAEEEETKRKLEKLIADEITREEEKQQQQQDIVSMDLTQEDDDDVIETTNDLLEDENDNEDDNDNEENYNDNDNDDDGDDNYDDTRNPQQLAPSNENNQYQNNSHNNNNNNNFNKDPRRLPNYPTTNNIPSLFDINISNNNPLSEMEGGRLPPSFNDPRLRMGNPRGPNNGNNMMMMGGNTNFNNFNTNFNSQQTNPPVASSIERNFVILKNCDYNTRINDVAQLLITANLGLKHIEPLWNERQLPTGEFIVEFRRTQDAERAIQHFHNIQFRNRSLRVFPILPQDIADRLNKPFLSYIPGGNGRRINDIAGGGGGVNNSNSNNHFNQSTNLMNNNGNNNNNINMGNNPRFGNNPLNQQQQLRSGMNSFRNGPENAPMDNLNNRIDGVDMENSNLNKSNDIEENVIDDCDDMDNNDSSNGIPEQFNRPDCVISLENVPYKAQLSDILRFFQGFELTADDIIRRFNDDGSPTGDARVAFPSADIARNAFEAKKRKQIFGRNIYLNIMK